LKFNFISFREILRTLVSLKDTPEKLSLSFAVGLFISLTPFFGIHSISAIFLSFVFKLNKTASFLGSWINTPLTMPFVYYIEYEIGSFIFNSHTAFSLTPYTIAHYLKGGWGIFIMITTGSAIFGSIVSSLFYILLKHILKRKMNVPS